MSTLCKFLAMAHMVKLIRSPSVGDNALCLSPGLNNIACPLRRTKLLFSKTSLPPGADCSSVVSVKCRICVLNAGQVSMCQS